MRPNRGVTSVLLNKGHRSEHVVDARTQERLNSPLLSPYGRDKMPNQRQALRNLRDAEIPAGVA